MNISVKKATWIFILISSGLFFSCETVHPYQRMYVDDKDMVLKPVPEAVYEINFESYREGAAGAIGKKAGGGCGCN
ncbi:MAG: DUF4266 domain-containing protein [Chitinophagales bacterium]|nr:DUF4266 domain-containing protein [Chitinophagales bacterium]